MKRAYFLLPLFLGLFLFQACSGSAGLIDKPQPSLTFEIKQSSGTNASAVAYNPNQELYYCVIAGNSDFPFEIFTSSGNNVYQQTAQWDTRGLWFDRDRGMIEGNGYASAGIFSYTLDSRGFPKGGPKTIFARNQQPSENSVGFYDYDKDEILFYDAGKIHRFERKSGNSLGKISLKDIPSDLIDINSTTGIYTGLQGMEIGLLNFEKKEIYLFNKMDGNFKEKVILPQSAITNSMFRFSFANGYAFLYDTESRSWTGYKIIK